MSPYETNYYAPARRRKNTRRDSRQVLYLTQLVVDYWLDEDSAIPVYTPFYYSSKIGDKNIRLWSEWDELGVPLRVDAVDYRGNIYLLSTPEYGELYNYAEEAHRILVNAIIAADNPPTSIIVRKNTWLIWLLMLETVALFFLITSQFK